MIALTDDMTDTIPKPHLLPSVHNGTVNLYLASELEVFNIFWS